MKYFMKECLEKFKRVAKEKRRTLTPWIAYKFRFLIDRLHDEITELDIEVNQHLLKEATEESLISLMEECKDVTLLSWFIYKKAGKELSLLRQRDY